VHRISNSTPYKRGKEAKLKMMNYIWVGMLMLGILFAGITGHFSEFSDGLMGSCTKAIEFVIGLAGIMAVWSGIMNIGKKTGLMDAAAKITQPFIQLLFPKEKNNETIAAILMSFSANIFGAGNCLFASSYDVT